MTMYLSLEHLNPDLVDLKVYVSLTNYRGTTVGFTSDDPDETTIESITLLESREYSEYGVKYNVFKGEELDTWFIDSKIKDQIYEEYQSRQ